MLVGQQPAAGEPAVDRCGHRRVRHGGVGGRHVRDEVGEAGAPGRRAAGGPGRGAAGIAGLPGGVVLFAGGAAGAAGGLLGVAGGGGAGLADVHLVAVPERVPLGGPAGVGVVGGAQAQSAGRETVRVLPPRDHLPPVLAGGAQVVLHQHHPQRLHRGQLGQPARRGGGVHGGQQREPVAAVGGGQFVPPGL